MRIIHIDDNTLLLSLNTEISIWYLHKSSETHFFEQINNMLLKIEISTT